MDRYLIDTSAWIEFFRKKEPWHSLISDLIDGDSICCNGLIYAELLQGAKSGKEIKTLKEFIHVFEFLEDSFELWERAGELSCHMRKIGKTVGLSDCYIAVMAKENNVILMTMDKHFESLVPETGLVLYKAEV